MLCAIFNIFTQLLCCSFEAPTKKRNRPIFFKLNCRKHSSALAMASKSDLSKRMNGTDEAGTVEAGTVEAGTVEAGTDEAGTVEAGTDEAGTDEAGTDEA